MNLLEFTAKGIYCPVADVYLDPWQPVKKASIKSMERIFFINTKDYVFSVWIWGPCSSSPFKKNVKEHLNRSPRYTNFHFSQHTPLHTHD